MQNMKVSRAERNFIIYMRLFNASEKANKWVLWCAKKFGTVQDTNTLFGKVKIRQFFGVQYLIK